MKNTLVELLQNATDTETLELLLKEFAQGAERRLFLLTDATQKYVATEGPRAFTWFEEDIVYLRRRCKMFWFLRKHSWLLMQMK